MARLRSDTPSTPPRRLRLTQLPAAAGLLEWIAHAAISGVIGLLIGAACIPIIGFVVAPAWKRLKGFLPGSDQQEA